MTTLTMAQPQPQAQPRREPDERTTVLPPGYVEVKPPRLVCVVQPNGIHRWVYVGDRPNPARGTGLPPKPGPVATFAASIRRDVARRPHRPPLPPTPVSQGVPTGAQLKAWREAKGLSQRDLARPGLSRGLVAEIERGVRKTVRVRLEMATLLGHGVSEGMQP